MTKQLTCTVILSIIISLGVVQAILICLFFKKHVRKHQNHPIYRVRHPLFLFVTVMVSPIRVITRSINGILIVNGIVSPFVYLVVLRFLLYCVGVAFPMTRMWHLWYDMKWQRIQQNIITRKSLDNTNDLTKISWFFHHPRFFGKPFYSLIMLETLFFVTWIINLLADIYDHEKRYLISTLSSLYIVTFNFIIVILLVSIWCNCCSKLRFNDGFNLRIEITLICCTLWFAFFYVTVIGFAVPDHTTGIILINIGNFLWNCCYILTAIIAPYTAWKKTHFTQMFEKNMSTPATSNSDISIENNTVAKQVSISDVLSHHIGFYLFMEHVTQELSNENLSFLVDVFQFKYGRSAKDKKMMKMKKFKWKEIKLEPITNDTIHSYESDINIKSKSDDDDGNNLFVYNGKDPYITLLSQLPWFELPKTALFDCDKYIHCHNIFNKYIDTFSYSSINISSYASNRIYNSLNVIHIIDSKQKNGSHSEILKKNWMKSENEFDLEIDLNYNEVLDVIFDVALQDVFANLNDSLHRFRSKSEFKTLNN